jgi:hypothetical protein
MSNLTRFVLLTLAGGCVSLSACSSTQTRSSDEERASYAVIDGERVPVPNIPMGDPETIAAIIEEGKDNSQVMDILTEMCTTFGPRLTGSTSMQQSQRWARDMFQSWGLVNARLDQWGNIETRFDRGPSTGRVLMQTSRRRDAEPTEVRTLEFTTLAWSNGTDGPESGPVLFLPKTMDEYELNKGKYANAWVLIEPNYAGRGGIRSTGFLMRQRMDERAEIRAETEKNKQMAMGEGAQLDPHTWSGTFEYNGSLVPATLTLNEDGETAEGNMEIRNFSEGPIADIKRDGNTVTFSWTHDMGTSNIELTFDGNTATGVSRAASGNEYALEFSHATQAEVDAEQEEEDTERMLMALVLEENPHGFVSSSKDERVWTTSSNNWRERKLSDYPVDVEVNVRQSDYDYLASRTMEGVDLTLEFDLQNKLAAGPFPVYNVIAEIPGTEFPDEVIVISGHMDSWNGPGSMGTTDNGTGTSVTIEAARILASVGAKPKRTIRFALWGGEEQGLLGSRGYIESLSEEERARISAAFVDDGGTNHQGGIPAADFMVEYLAAATAPVNGVFYSETDGKYLDVNIRPTGAKIETHGGSDHAAFNAVGVPGFFWDEVGRAEYGYGWHTQNDNLDLAIEEYLVQSATNTAITAYNLANAPGLLPREGETFEVEEIEPTANAQD